MCIILRSHFKKCHNLTMKEYSVKTGCVLDENRGKSLGYANYDLQDATNNQVNGALIAEAYLSGHGQDRDNFLYLGKSIQELCHGATTSKSMSNLCRYSCHKCGEVKKGWLNFKHHQRATHRIKDVCMTEAAKFLTKPICYVCKICSTKLLCDRKFIQRHLHCKHKLSLNQYIKEHVPGMCQLVPKATYSNNTLGNLCIYECRACGDVFKSSGALARHRIRLEHKSCTVLECLTKRVYHKCKLCNKSIFCDIQMLHSHIKCCHNMTLKEYARKKKCKFVSSYYADKTFIETLKLSKTLYNSCTFACNACNRRHSSFAAFKTHFRKCQANYEGPLTKYVVKGLSYKCAKCNKLFLCDRFTVSQHWKMTHKQSMDDKAENKTKSQYDNLCKSFLNSIPVSSNIWHRKTLPMSEVPINEVNSKIGNFCKFICPKCKMEDFSSWNVLRRHVNSAHGCDIKYDYSLVSVARNHACLICPKVMLCDRQFIAEHLSGAHKMKIKIYEKIFLRNGGETLPTFDEWMTGETNKNQ